MPDAATQSILHMKDDVNQLTYQALQLRAEKLNSEGADNVDVTLFENELIDSMKRIYSLSKRIAKLTVPDSLIQEEA
jgi:phosphate:Na+ symporter